MVAISSWLRKSWEDGWGGSAIQNEQFRPRQFRTQFIISLCSSQVEIHYIVFLSLAGLASLLLFVVIIHCLAMAFCPRQQQSQLYQLGHQERQQGPNEDNLKIFTPRICAIK